MSDFNLQRLGILMEPERGNLQEVEGVLNPAAARGRDGELYLFPRLVAQGGLLTKNRVSNNVGPCQAFFERTTACTPRRASFRFGRWCCLSNRRLARNRFPGQELSPTHASLRSQPRS
jgi:hypothetical protein